MFSLKEFIKQGLIDAIGKLGAYQVILNAAGWHDKGVLEEEDLIEIQNAIDAKNIVIDNEIKDPTYEIEEVTQ